MSKVDKVESKFEVLRDDPWLEPFGGEIQRR